MRIAAAVCLTVASLLVGFAHRPLPGFSTGADLVAAGGIASGSVCGARVALGRPGEAPAARIATAPCDACLLVSAPGLGAVAEIVPPPPIDRPIARLGSDDEGAHDREAPPASARGPPSLG